jgi:hypothetical protein
VIAGDYLFLPGGTLDVGTQSNPIPATVTALIESANQTINTGFDPSQYGDSLIGLGNVTIYGAAKTPFVQLAVAPQAGATILYLAQPVTGREVGDELYLPDNRQLYYSDDPASGNFLALGRTTNAGFNDTTYNSNGQVTAIGTNERDRSPVVFLDLWEPTTPQADGYQYTFADNVVICPMTPQTHIWGIEDNNSSHSLIQGNFVIN